MGKATESICMFCCDVLQSHIGQVQDQEIFAEFCSKILNIGEGLQELSPELSVCSECISFLKKATSVREDVIDVERRVSSLQVSLLAELNKLNQKMKWFFRNVKVIADVVEDSNFQDEGNDTVRRIRREILNVSKNLKSFNNNLTDRLLVRGASGARPAEKNLTDHQTQKEPHLPITTSTGFNENPNPEPVVVSPGSGPMPTIVKQDDNSDLMTTSTDGRQESVEPQSHVAENLLLLTDTLGAVDNGADPPSETFSPVGDDMIEIGDVKMVHSHSEIVNGREEQDDSEGESTTSVDMDQVGCDDERDYDYTPESNLDANWISESENSQSMELLWERGKYKSYQFLQAIPPQFQAEARNPKDWGTINRKTGKHRCKRCSKEFNTITGFHLHYNNIHLQVRFKCTPCGREFRNKYLFYNHYNACHMGAIYKCAKCQKIFGSKRKQVFKAHKLLCGGTVKSVIGSSHAIQNPLQPSLARATGHSLEETGKCEICRHEVGSQCNHQPAVPPEPATASSRITRKRKAQPAEA